MVSKRHRTALRVKSHEVEEMLQVACEARERAYAPYSGYRVGAAVLDELGRIHAGCNVENISYGATICAERAAVTRMIGEGGREIRAVAVITQDGVAPCGMCLQVLSEFAKDPSKVEVACQATDGSTSTFLLSELMPKAFRSSHVARTSTKNGGSTST